MHCRKQSLGIHHLENFWIPVRLVEVVFMDINIHLNSGPYVLSSFFHYNRHLVNMSKQLQDIYFHMPQLLVIQLTYLCKETQTNNIK